MFLSPFHHPGQSSGELGASLSVLVDLATRTDLRNDNINVLNAKKDSKISDSRRSLIVPALKRLRGSQVERIGLQFFELLLKAVRGRHIAPIEVLTRRTG